MISIIFLIAFIIFAAKHSSSIKLKKDKIIENGIDEDSFDIYIIGLWLYFIPPLFAILLPIAYKIYTVPLFAAFYLPSIIIGLKISKKLDRGYDFIRQIGKEVNQAVWIGYGGIALVIFNWLVIYTSFSIMQ